MTKVTFGYAMGREVEERVLKFCRNYLPNAKLRHAICEGGEIRIVPYGSYK